MFYVDLGTTCQLGSGGDIRAVGWLSGLEPFAKGAAPTNFPALLKEHIATAWQPIVAAGVHRCELCHSNPDRNGGNLWIPSSTVVYIAPQMILHYVESHNYLPPMEFIDAVIECPAQASIEFEKLMEPFLHYWQPPKS